MSSSRPPVERGQAGMTRQNYLVERNRARRAKFEPTRQAIEADELHIAEERAKEKEERVDAWKASMSTMNSSVGRTRPLPGGGPRNTTVKGERPLSMYQQEKNEQTRKKAEYHSLYKADMKEQVALRQQTLKEMKDEEDRQMAALNALNEEAAREAADEEFKAREENKAYLERMRETNVREMAAQRRRAKEDQMRDAALQRIVNENSRHAAEMDERRQKNMTNMLKLQNDQFHNDATRQAEDVRMREAAEMAAAVELDKQATAADREAQEAKRERFRQEFDDAVARDKAFRREHNYEEPKHITRQRNTLAAESHRLVQQEEALRTAQRKAEYERDLMDQIVSKQKYAMTHLDEV